MFFDNKFSEETVSELLTYLEEGFFISSSTSKIDVEFLAYNPEVNIFTMVLVKFEFESTGTLSVSPTVKQFAASRYDMNREEVRVRVAFEVLFVLLFLYQIFLEIDELVELKHNWPQYFQSGSNLLDIFSIGKDPGRRACSYMHHDTFNARQWVSRHRVRIKRPLTLNLNTEPSLALNLDPEPDPQP